MKLFIANTTKQHHEFTYRAPESTRTSVQRIAVGACVQIWKDDTRANLEAIIGQHIGYGVVPAAEIDRTKGFIGLCYSYDKPINVDAIQRGLAHNDAVLKDRGAALRKEAAVSMAQVAENATRDEGVPMTSFESTIEEVDRRDGSNTSVNEVIQVSDDAKPTRRARRS